MRQRFLAFLGANRGPNLHAKLLKQAKASHGLEPVLTGQRMAVAISPDCPRHLFADGNGVVIGHLFERRSNTPAPKILAPTLCHDIQADHGHRLKERFWGGYAAFIDDPGSGTGFALRDPSGAVPCYRIALGGGASAFTSDAALARDLGLIEGRIDWRVILNQLLYRNLRQSSTAIEECEEVLPGTGQSWDGRPLPYWDPSRHAGQARMVSDPAEAAALLRGSVFRSVSAWSHCYRHILLELSGGLDSSIVAAALAQAGARFSCVTLVTPTPDGDERRYARIVANACGAPLLERRHDPRLIDPTRSAMPHLPRPTGRAFAQSSDQLLATAAEDLGADAFFSGGGGDNAFCYSGSAAPAADRLLISGPGRRFFATLRDVAAISHCTVWETIPPSLRQAFGRRRIWPRDQRLLSQEAVANADRPFHPWLTELHRSLPGKRRHIELIVAILSHIDGLQRATQRPVVFPLLSQPVMEACLRIPSWLFVSGGVNRAAAREAFSGDLPAEILRRRSKGGVANLAGTIFAAHREAIRSLVLDGGLSQNGLIDRAGTEAILNQDGSLTGVDFHRILAFAEIEAWARHWT